MSIRGRPAGGASSARPVWPAPAGGPSAFRSVRREAEVGLAIRRSRFVAHVAPVDGVAEARAWLEAARALHPRATHQVPAFVAGFRGEERWCSDGGEPPGTAGRPVLEVLERQGVVQVAVLVARYFGGTKLGAAGLVRAYADACAAGLREAGLVTFRRGRRGRVVAPYATYGPLRAWLQGRGVRVLAEGFGVHVTLELWVPEDQVAALATEVADRSAGAARWEPGPWEYRAADAVG